MGSSKVTVRDHGKMIDESRSVRVLGIVTGLRKIGLEAWVVFHLEVVEVDLAKPTC